LTTGAEVAHGYTMSDLDSIARIAAARRGAGYAYAEAWSGAAELLCGTADRPQFYELLQSAMNGIDRETRAYMHARGLYDSSSAATGSQFYRFWAGAPRLASPWEDDVVDRLAFLQVWPWLSPLHQEALVTLATVDQYDLAAEALGISYAAFILRVRRARAAFRSLWHDWESPSRTWGRDERKRRGDKSAMESRYDATRRPSRHRPSVHPDGEIDGSSVNPAVEGGVPTP
jgi:hypothetical protein